MLLGVQGQAACDLPEMLGWKDGSAVIGSLRRPRPQDGPRSWLNPRLQWRPQWARMGGSSGAQDVPCDGGSAGGGAGEDQEAVRGDQGKGVRLRCDQPNQSLPTLPVQREQQQWTCLHSPRPQLSTHRCIRVANRYSTNKRRGGLAEATTIA